MALLRTQEMTEKYRKHRESLPTGGPCVLCEKSPLQTFKLWKIIKNDFPYDHIAQEHDMLVPLRHVTETNLNDEEKLELKGIKIENSFNSKYDFIIEAVKKHKSLPNHFHLHLVTVKDKLTK